MERYNDKKDKKDLGLQSGILAQIQNDVYYPAFLRYKGDDERANEYMEVSPDSYRWWQLEAMHRANIDAARACAEALWGSYTEEANATFADLTDSEKRFLLLEVTGQDIDKPEDWMW